MNQLWFLVTFHTQYFITSSILRLYKAYYHLHNLKSQFPSLLKKGHTEKFWITKVLEQTQPKQFIHKNYMTYLSLSSTIYLISDYEWALIPQCETHRPEVRKVVRSLWERQSNASYRSLNNAPNDFPLSTFFKPS